MTWICQTAEMECEFANMFNVCSCKIHSNIIIARTKPYFRVSFQNQG